MLIQYPIDTGADQHRLLTLRHEVRSAHKIRKEERKGTDTKKLKGERINGQKKKKPY